MQNWIVCVCGKYRRVCHTCALCTPVCKVDDFFFFLFLLQKLLFMQPSFDSLSSLFVGLIQ